MTTIILTKGQTTIVDDGFDLEYLYHFSIAYAVRSTWDKRTIFLHRDIWEQHYGKIPDGMEIDHINGDKLDNRLANLRLATHAQNTTNRAKRNSPTSSRFKGVCWKKDIGRWMAYITCDRKRTYLGYFDTEEAAAIAYDNAAKQQHEEYAWLNMSG